jgi:hypothetical protein
LPLSASSRSGSPVNKEHLLVRSLDYLIGGVPLLFLRQVADIAGMDQEGWLGWIAFILAIASASVAVGFGLNGTASP